MSGEGEQARATRFPLPTAAQVDAELQKLPTLARSDLEGMYLGDKDIWRLIEYHGRSERNAQAVCWLTEMYALWRDIRLSLASAMAIDSSYGGLPDDPFPELSEEAYQSFGEANYWCGYHVDNAIYRFYAFNEKFLQFCNGYLALGLSEHEVRGASIEKALRARGEECAFFLDQLSRLWQFPVYRDVTEARRGITHRKHPLLGDGVDPPLHMSVYYMRLAQDLFVEITALLDRLLGRIAADDERQRASR